MNSHQGLGAGLPVPAGQSAADKASYSVAVLGFSETEHVALENIFRLSARRDPSFVPFAPGEHKAPDLYLVDADDGRFASHLATIASTGAARILLVGASAHGTDHALMPRPLRWTRTLEMFEEAMSLAPSEKPAARKTDRVLVVDDSAPVRKFMEMKLAPFMFEVDFAESGEQAIALAAENFYTCVFLDVILPGVDGYQVCKTIKERAGGERTAVVMLTGKKSTFDKIRGTMAGCDAYITKPVDEEKLLEVIAKFLPKGGNIERTSLALRSG